MMRKIQALNLRERYSVVLFALFVVAVFFRDVSGLPVPSVFLTALAFLLFFANDFKYIGAFLAFVLPSSAGIPNLAIFSLVMIFGVLKISKSIRVNTWVLVCVILIAMRELFAAFNPAFAFQQRIFVNFFVLFFLIYLFIPSCYKKLDFSLMLKAYLWGVLFMAANIFFQFVAVYGLREFLDLGVRIGNTQTHFDFGGTGHRVSNDQNLLGVFCSTALYVFLIMNHKKLLPWYYALLLPPIIGFGLLTQSRGFLFSVATIFAYYILAVILEQRRSAVKSSSAIIIPIVTAILCFVAFFHFLPQYGDNLIERLERDDVTGGRADIMASFNRFLLGNPLYLFRGAGGIQGYRTLAGVTYSVHNGFQEILLTWGFLGFVIVAVLMYNLYRIAKSGRKLDFLGFLPLIMYFFDLVTAQWFSSTGMLFLNLIWFSTTKMLTTLPQEMLTQQPLVSEELQKVKKSYA